MKSITRPLVITFSIALIVVASMPAMSAQPAKPAATPSIYGTPAQLVADFESAGYDLRKMVYNRQGQMPSPWTRQNDSSGYEHGNTVLARISHSGKLYFICITSPVFSKFVSGEPTGNFKYVFRMSPEEVIQRYGSEHMYHAVLTGQSGRLVHDVVTYMLLNEPTDDVWEIRLTWDNHDRLASIYAGLHFGCIVRVDVDRPDLSTPVGRLYSDLEDMGIGFLKPVGHQEVLMRNSQITDEENEAKSYQRDFHNGWIRFSNNMKDVNAFGLFLYIPGGHYDLQATVQQEGQTPQTYPLDEMSDLLDDISCRDACYGISYSRIEWGRFFSFLLEREGEYYFSECSFDIWNTSKGEKDALYINGYVSGSLYLMK